MAALYTMVIYVGTYTDKSVPSDGIYTYKLVFDNDLNSFTSSQIESTKVISPSFLTVSHNKKFLLAVSEASTTNDTQIHSYNILSDGKLKHVNSLTTLGTYSCYVSVDENDKFAYAASYFGGVASSFSIHEQTGRLELKNHVTFHESRNVQPRQEAPHIHMIATTPDNRFVYSTDLGNDVIRKFAHSESKGFDETNIKAFKVDQGAGPRHFTFNPNGKYLYLSAELSNTVHVYEIDAVTGDLSFKNSYTSSPSEFKGTNLIAEIRSSQDGRTLYVSNRGHDSLAVFNVEENGAKLVLKKFVSTNGQFPRNFDLNDRVLIVANQESNQLNVFKIERDGDLRPIGQAIKCPQPVRVKIF